MVGGDPMFKRILLVPDGSVHALRASIKAKSIAEITPEESEDQKSSNIQMNKIMI